MALLGELRVDVTGTFLLLLKMIDFMIRAKLPCFAHFLFAEPSCLASSPAFLLALYCPL